MLETGCQIPVRGSSHQGWSFAGYTWSLSLPLCLLSGRHEVSNFAFPHGPAPCSAAPGPRNNGLICHGLKPLKPQTSADSLPFMDPLGYHGHSYVPVDCERRARGSSCVHPSSCSSIHRSSWISLCEHRSWSAPCPAHSWTFVDSSFIAYE